MTAEIAIQVDDRIVRYLEAQAIEKQKSRAEALAELVDEWYEGTLHQLYQHYLTGDLTLRGMARQLGLSYRELYQAFEDRDLSF
jgi:AraC-like DNA-binding protein